MARYARPRYARRSQEVNRTVTEASTMQQIGDHQAARDIYGLVDRKVVKQTIMTSVYGVTFIGARQQVRRTSNENNNLKYSLHAILD